jgi:hypothetical protein
VNDTEPEPKWTFHMDRASARTTEEREEHYLAWLSKRELEDDDPRRRQTWFRRYTQPARPSSIAPKSLSQIRGKS